MSGITVDQATVEKALVMHLMGDTLGDPANRDQLLTDLISKIISEKEYAHDKDSLLEKHVKAALGSKVKEIAAEWLDRPEIKIEIEKQVSDILLGNTFVKDAMEAAAKSISERFKRGY